LRISFKRLVPHAREPERAHDHDAGYDLRAAESARIGPGERTSVGTGLAVAIPEGHAGLVLPRSGLAARHGIGVVNGPGLIDPEYRGEVKVILVNHGSDAWTAQPGDRVAQLLLVRFDAPEVEVVAELPPSADDRGAGGFGSSGR